MIDQLLSFFSAETTLFGGRYMPITDSISFLHAPLDKIVATFNVWRYPDSVHDMGLEENPGSLEEHLRGFEPFGETFYQEPCFLLTDTASGEWTAVLSDHWAGSWQDRLAQRIGYVLGVDDVDVRLAWPSPEVERRPGADAGLCLQHNRSDGTFPISRSRALVRRNIFWHPGTDVPMYQFKETTTPVEGLRATAETAAPLDRFNPLDLVACCRALGIDVFDEDFYTNRAVKVFDHHLLNTAEMDYDEDLSTYEGLQKYYCIRGLVDPGDGNL